MIWSQRVFVATTPKLENRSPGGIKTSSTHKGSCGSRLEVRVPNSQKTDSVSMDSDVTPCLRRLVTWSTHARDQHYEEVGIAELSDCGILVEFTALKPNPYTGILPRRQRQQKTVHLARKQGSFSDFIC